MHIPDGFLDTKTWIGMGCISTVFIGVAVRQANKKISEKHIPLLGVMAAFVFAAQMFNFPVGGGTSGHFMGTTLIAILLGPWGFCADNDNGAYRTMPGIPGWWSYSTRGKYIQYGHCGWIFWILCIHHYPAFCSGQKGLFIGSFTAAWCSLVLSATCCAVELSISGTAPLKIVLPAMAGIHAMIGIGEGFITIATLSMLTRVRPDLLELQKI